MSLAFVGLVSSLLVPAGTPEIERAPDTIVICAPALRDALGPWIDYRSAQGHQLRVVTDTDSAESVQGAIRLAARSGRLRNVLIVGDVQLDPSSVDLHVPTHLAEAQINTRWGSEPEIATDNGFADLDDDVVPDLTLGRLPADSPEQLRLMIRKIIRYEDSPPIGMWQRRINVVAGVGGFGALADTVLETATRSFISRGIPEGYRTSMTYASWRSPYCPDPRSFRRQVIQRLNEGCLCWVYIGHGHRQGLDWIRVPVGVAPILNNDDASLVACTPGPPIALFLSCYASAFDGAEDCIAERLLAQPEGPIAAIGGSRVTMPYGMAVLSRGLMHQMFHDRPATIGELLLRAKQQMLAPRDVDWQQPWLDALARALSPNPDDLEGERREHVMMFQLLGDPLTRIPHARSVDVDVERTVLPGQTLRVKCCSDVLGKGTVELVCRRGRLTFTPERRTEFDDSHEGMRQLTRVYRQANNDRLAIHPIEPVESEFETVLRIPERARGPYVVRVFLAGDDACAIGSASVFVARPSTREDSTPTEAP